MSELERKQINGVAVYTPPTSTSNPNVKRRQGAKTIVPVGSVPDNALNSTDASISKPVNNRYTFLLNQGDDNGGS